MDGDTNTLSPLDSRGPPRRALFGVLSLCLAPLAAAAPRPNGRNHTDTIGVVSPINTPLEESNFQACKKMIQEVIVTGGTQPGLNNVAGGFYRDTNPGPYPFGTALGSDPRDHLDDSAFIVHPYLAMASVADLVDGIAGSDNLKSLWNQGLKNASDLAFETCCDGTLFGFALPFSQNLSNAAGSSQLVEDLRYYLAISGIFNQTDELWYAGMLTSTAQRALALSHSRFARSQPVRTPTYQPRLG